MKDLILLFVAGVFLGMGIASPPNRMLRISIVDEEPKENKKCQPEPGT